MGRAKGTPKLRLRDPMLSSVFDKWGALDIPIVVSTIQMEKSETDLRENAIRAAGKNVA